MNMFGNLGKMGEMMKKAKELQDEIKRARYESEEGGIRVVINGEMEITELFIPPGISSDQAASKVRSAVNKGMKAAKDDLGKKMQKITGGLGGLGGLAGLPGM
jgi:nucleoid-associated protein EbfC